MATTVAGVTTTNSTITTTTSSPHSPWDDATWILTSAFIIFTMQSGFGLLESGMATRRNEVNIMMKNAIDVVFGGMLYWAVGYGISFGTSAGSNAFSGWGSFFLDPDDEHIGTEFSKFTFQASFATTATTIVSGAMAERTKLHAYIVFCLTNTIVYSFPAHWVWAPNGWLKQLNVVDVAGVGPVHLVGGVTALIAAIMLKPRYGRFGGRIKLTSSSPVNSLLGLFILWWGWLGFNCGSTFGISGGKWKLAAKAAATTIMASCGGGITAFFISFVFYKRITKVRLITNGILGSLVSITGICAVTQCWAAIIIGCVGAIIEAAGEVLLLKFKIDDPVGATAVHFFCSVWGLLCCGLFANVDTIQNKAFAAHAGIFMGGDFYLLGVQCLAVVSIIAWSAIVSFINLKILDLTIGLRVDIEDELLGADIYEHMCYPPGFDLEDAKKSIHKRVAKDRMFGFIKAKPKEKEVTTDGSSCMCFFGKSRVLTKNIVHPNEQDQGSSQNGDRDQKKNSKLSDSRLRLVANDNICISDIENDQDNRSVNSDKSMGEANSVDSVRRRSRASSGKDSFQDTDREKPCQIM
ncbi:hypothetical protein SNE40_011939 [Patella caerulea]|uniref:Ammonium transporter n=1 Tax=Patella caerulea TaxID=87958 RepID=A0AAN8PPZ5_PATCE